jgi:hypothetical protein
LVHHCTKGATHHGEFELTLLEDILLEDLIGFGLIALLGFLPLTIIHLADRRPKLRLPRRASLSMIKASLLALLADWASTIHL